VDSLVNADDTRADRSAEPAPARPLMKGQQTRAAILDAALALASHIGLEGSRSAPWPR
jgi:hypothetical protein